MSAQKYEGKTSDMTKTPNERRSIAEEVQATDAGSQGLAAAELSGQVMRLLLQAFDQSGISQRELANKVGVTEARVSQILNGDGNLRVAALARYLRALDYDAAIAARSPDAEKKDLPLPKRRSRMVTADDKFARMLFGSPSPSSGINVLPSPETEVENSAGRNDLHFIAGGGGFAIGHFEQLSDVLAVTHWTSSSHYSGRFKRHDEARENLDSVDSSGSWR